MFGGEIDFAALQETCEKADRGDSLSRFVAEGAVLQLVERVSHWQWVIHGDTKGYRRAAVKFLLDEKRFKRAKEFASCGRADAAYLGEGTGQAKVRTRGCGNRMCPRCSRRAGHRVLRRVASHLSSGSHGPLVHVVLTQQAREGEPLSATMERFADKWKRFHRLLKREGMTSGLATYHVKRSRGKWWHYHCHLVMELADGANLPAVEASLNGKWTGLCESVGEGSKPLFFRKICEAGAAIDEFAAQSQGELWRESRDKTVASLQYIVRDVVQGCEGWVEGVEDARLVKEFGHGVEGAKLHRLFGKWRKKLEAASEVEGEAADPSKSSCLAPTQASAEETKWLKVGTVDTAIVWGLTGVGIGFEWARALHATCSNKSAVGMRVASLLRRMQL